ncbi:MAG TPA: DUF1080 domain-containing protein, partial [Verrucomicrobiales bacterium]|nr:DUF1080 domain-containing protein [Verrucomicrobiales bacterium]
MKKNYTLLLMALMGLIITSAKSEDKWITLFNGKKVTGLRGYGQKGFPEKAWKVEAGTLKTITRGQGGQPRDLVTVGSFTDFEFECEWKVSPRGNSGIMYR